MDFKTQLAAAGRTDSGLAGVATDALLVVLGTAAAAATLDKPLADELARAIKDGDFECKGGQLLYAHRVAGVKAGRVLFAFAGDTSAKGLRRAVAAGVAQIKGGGAKA